MNKEQKISRLVSYIKNEIDKRESYLKESGIFTNDEKYIDLNEYVSENEFELIKGKLSELDETERIIEIHTKYLNEKNNTLIEENFQTIYYTIMIGNF